jgi:hypothetical protein
MVGRSGQAKVALLCGLPHRCVFSRPESCLVSGATPMADDKKPAYKEIIIGVTIGVLTAAITAAFGLREGGIGGLPVPRVNIPKATPDPLRQATMGSDSTQQSRNREGSGGHSASSEAGMPTEGMKRGSPVVSRPASLTEKAIPSTSPTAGRKAFLQGEIRNLQDRIKQLEVQDKMLSTEYDSLARLAEGKVTDPEVSRRIGGAIYQLSNVQLQMVQLIAQLNEKQERLEVLEKGEAKAIDANHVGTPKFGGR